jgi:hypothetical protein
MQPQENRTIDCKALQDLIPEYAFGLTDSEQARWVESNLPFCPDAATQLAEYRQIQQELRGDLPQIAPPAHLEQHLMDAIADAPKIEVMPRTRRRFGTGWIAAAAAVVALVLTNLFWIVRQSGTTTQPMGTPTPAFVIASTSNLRTVRLPPLPNISTDASAFLMWNAESEIGILYVHGLPKLDPNQTYQLWLTRGPEFASAGTFQVGADGEGTLLFHISESIDKYTWARITTEPANGSKSPGGTVVVVGKL